MNTGELREDEFKISNRERGYYDENGNWMVDPGQFQLWISIDSESGVPVDFMLDELLDA